MRPKPTEAQDAALLDDVLASPCGIWLSEIPRTQTKTPDFEMRTWRGFAGYCELKSPYDDFLDLQLENAPAFTIVGTPRKDPTFNRIARHIQDAVKQFEAVNPDHVHPNLLVFVNHACDSQGGDLIETLTGRLDTDAGSYTTMPHISEGRLGRIKNQIDSYVWIDAATRRIEAVVWSESNAGHTAALHETLRSILPHCRRRAGEHL